MHDKTCCFFGHREINETEELKKHLFSVVENLINDKKVGTFLFGSNGRFNDISYDVVACLKEKYPHIKRIYVRAEYRQIDDDYLQYLLNRYEYTYYPERIIGAGKAVYVERNYEMIDKSDFCVVYYETDYSPKKRKSGTKIALDYAIKKKSEVIVLP